MSDYSHCPNQSSAIATSLSPRLWTIAASIGTLMVLVARVIFVPPLHAQPSRICATGETYAPAAATTRTVELANFGIQINIPSNYRTMRFQDGRVAILHPDDFALLQCLAQGGRGGRGYYSEQIQWVAPDNALTLREQAQWSMGFEVTATGDRQPYATEVRAYEANGIAGYLSWTPGSYSVTFLGTIPGYEDLLSISASCDCEVEPEAVLTLLDGVRPIAD